MIFLKLFLAHLLGDFVFQPASWVAKKESLKLKSWQFYAHIFVHGILSMLLLWDISMILPVLIIMVSHGIIDAIKLYSQGTNKRSWFAIDQILHLLVITAVWYVVCQPEINLQFEESTLAILTGVIFITTPSSILIKMLISQWTPSESATNDSLQHAGKYIGILERLLVFTFAITNKWEAIGFLIAAKSVFRFGDLKDAKDLKLTEYVLIGTLLSFGIAVATTLLIKAIL